MRAAQDLSRWRKQLANVADSTWSMRTSHRVVWTVAHEFSQRTEARELQITLHRNLPGGRGSATIAVPIDGDLTAIEQLAAQCARQLMAPWRDPPTSAPAKAANHDPAIEREIQSRIAQLTVASEEVRNFELVSESVVVETSARQPVQWRQTQASAALKPRGSERSVTLVARSLRGLAIQAHVLASRSTTEPGLASRTPRGEVTIVLDAPAMLFDGLRGIWEVLVHHATAKPATEGLLASLRFAEWLEISSFGTLDDAWFSAPLDDEGGAIRNFVIARSGKLNERGATAIAAGMLGLPSNGGIRNLLVADRSNKTLPARYLRVHRMSEVNVNRTSGRLIAHLDSGTLVEGTSETRVVGGWLQLDLLEGLQTLHMSGPQIVTTAYRGPQQLVITGSVIS